MTTQNSTNNVFIGSGAGATSYINYFPPSASVRSQLNVSSIDILATGRYRLNFINAYSNANYYAIVTLSVGSGSGEIDTAAAVPTTTQLRIAAVYSAYATPNYLICAVTP